jgi:CheY-like chemotaxis protein
MSANHTILIADDEAHITHILRLKLGQFGYDVHVAQDGEEALVMARELVPSLIVTDLNMPRLTGFEVAAKLAEDVTTAAIPIILLTARGHTLADEQVGRTNIVATMDKPFSVKTIAARIAELLTLDAGAAKAG